jgi:putative toxin-antitoxin system antitoxin component (TIGR02293 family)
METSFSDLAGMLEISGRGGSAAAPLNIIGQIQQGLSVATLYKVTGQIAPDDAQFVFRIIPRASLARRKSGSKLLTADESDRLARLANVWTLAKKVWQSAEGARDFLFRAHPMLDGRKPIDVILQSELGAELVRNILGGLMHGTAV